MPVKIADLIGDPLYQVNLLLWMLQPSTGRPVNPLLHDAGLRLRDIERELPLPIDLASRLQTEGLAVRNPVTPDVLVDSPEKMFLALECKRSMFGSQPQPGMSDGAIRQARSLLLQTPLILASALGLQARDVHGTHLLYIARYEPDVNQVEGLQDLAQELRHKSFQTAPFGVLGLAVEGKTVALKHCPAPSLVPAALEARLAEQNVVHEIRDDGTDPRPLYFLPWMPESEPAVDDYNQAAFGNRILAAAMEVIGPCKPPCEIELDVEALLRKATLGVYDKWRNKGDRRTLQHNARELLRSQLKKASAAVVMSPLDTPRRGWKISVMDDTTHGKIIEGFRKWQQERWNKPVEPTLFDQLEENE